MNRFLKSIIIFSALSLGVFAFGLRAQAAPTTAPLYGYAWSDSAGWISMNCDNSGANAGYQINTCAGSGGIYGVTLDTTTGEMRGLGWSDNIGWIRFDQTVMTPSLAGNRLGGAKVTGIDIAGVRPVVGWARFCSDFTNTTKPDNCGSDTNIITDQNGGWNGWVAMAGKAQSGDLFGVTYDTTLGLFSGYAWGGTVFSSGTEVAGWISFDGVSSVPKITPRYIPIISLKALPGNTVPAGGSLTGGISYNWQNSIDADIVNYPLRKFDKCNIVGSGGFSDLFSTHIIGGVPVTGPLLTGWDSTTFAPGGVALPSTTSPIGGTNQNTYVYAPDTTYYLDCINYEGIRAGKVPAPGQVAIPCDPATKATAMATCPQVTVTVTPDPGNNILLEGNSSITNPSYSQGPFSVDPGETVSMKWTSSGSGWSNCQANIPASGTTQNIPLWKFSGVGQPIFKNVPTTNGIGSTESGISVPSNPTLYSITCLNSSGTAVQSNVVEVSKNMGVLGDLTLKIKLYSDSNSLFTSADIYASSTDTVDLRWESSADITPDSCFSTSTPSVYWTNAAGTLADASLPATGNAQIPMATGKSHNPAYPSTTTYTINCDATIGGISGQPLPPASVRVITLEPLTPSIDVVNSCVPDDTTVFSPVVTVNNLAGANNCMLLDGVGVPAWTGPFSVPIGNNSYIVPVPSVIPNFTISSSTLFSIKCDGTLKSFTVDVDPACNPPSNRNWFFRFFER